MGANCTRCDECEDVIPALQAADREMLRKIGDLEKKASEIFGRLPPLEEQTDDMWLLYKEFERKTDIGGRVAALEQDIKKLREGVVDALSRVPRLEKQADDLGALTQHHEKALHEMSKSIARVTSATVQIFPRGDAPDLLQFLTHCDGALDCSPDGEIRLIFPEGAPVPLSDLMTAASLLRAHDPEGPIGVAYDGGIVVLLRPAPKEGRA